MTIEKKSPNWAQYDRYTRICDLAEIILHNLVFKGASSQDDNKKTIGFKSFDIDEQTIKLAEEISEAKRQVEFMEHIENITMESMISIMNCFKALIEKCNELSKEQKEQCEKEDRAIAFKEILGQMVELGDSLPDVVNSEKVGEYLKIK